MSGCNKIFAHYRNLLRAKFITSHSLSLSTNWNDCFRLISLSENKQGRGAGGQGGPRTKFGNHWINN